MLDGSNVLGRLDAQTRVHHREADGPWLRLLEVDVVIRAGKVYFRKSCPSCGPSEALVSEEWLWRQNRSDLQTIGSYTRTIRRLPGSE